MDFELDAGTGDSVQQALQPLDVRSLLDRMDEVLILQRAGPERYDCLKEHF
jgi:hypothetical protein